MVTGMTECVHMIIAGKSSYRCKLCEEFWPMVGHGVPAGPGARLYRKLHSMGLPECDACRHAAFQMDLWGEEGCRLNKKSILTRLKRELWRITLTGNVDSIIENWLETEGIITWE